MPTSDAIDYSEPFKLRNRPDVLNLLRDRWIEETKLPGATMSTLWREAPTGTEYCIVATRRGGTDIVGIVTCFMANHFQQWWIDLIIVDTDHRRQGIGRELMTRATDHAKRQGARHVGYATMTNNDAMHAMARQIGATAFGTMFVIG